MDLTERKLQLLKAIVEEFMETAEAVGSQILADKYDLQVSPATIRNEMSDLVEMGYLVKEHVSAGRVPGPWAYRVYLEQLIDEEEIPVVSEVTIKQRIWQERNDTGRLMRQVVQALADETQNLAVAITSDGRIYSAGSVHILRHPEFYNIDLTRSVLHMLDKADVLQSIFERTQDRGGVGVLMADELGLNGLSDCSVVYGDFSLPNHQTARFAILGPMRMDYPRVMPVVRYFKQVLDELTRGW